MSGSQQALAQALAFDYVHDGHKATLKNAMSDGANIIMAQKSFPSLE